MPICPQCRAEIPEGQTVCAYCGTEIELQPTYVRFDFPDNDRFGEGTISYDGKTRKVAKGEIVHIDISKETEFVIKLKGSIGAAKIKAKPGETYSVIGKLGSPKIDRI